MVYEKMTALANAIRSKTGGTDLLTLDGMAEAVNGLSIGGGGDLTVRTGTITLAEDVSETYYLEHNCGFKPKIFICKTNVASSVNYGLIAITKYDPSFFVTDISNSFDYFMFGTHYKNTNPNGFRGSQYANEAETKMSITNNGFGTSGMQLPAGTTLYWIAIG